MRQQAARDNHQPGRVFVEPMNDPATGQLSEARSMVQERVLQGPIRMTRCRMHDQPGRLVDDNQVLIFKLDLQRDRLRQTITNALKQRLHQHLLGPAHAILRPRSVPVKQHPPLLDPGLQAASRERRQQLGEHLIEPPPGVLGLQSQVLCLGFLQPSLLQSGSPKLGRRERINGLGWFCDSHGDSVYWRDCDADDVLGDYRQAST